MSSTDDFTRPPQDNSDQGSQLLLTIIIGFAVLVTLILLFEIARKVAPGIYEARLFFSKQFPTVKDWNYKSVQPPPQRPQITRLPFWWIWQINAIENSDLLKTHGPDVVSAVASVQELFFMFLFLTVINMIILAPAYATGTNKDLPQVNPQYVGNILIISMSNLQRGDNILWLSWVMEVVSPFVIYFFLLRGIKQYAQRRRQYLRAEIPCNYSVMLNDIPPEFRSAQKVRHFFETLFPGEVALVRYAVIAKPLLALQNNYWKSVRNREYYQYLEANRKEGEKVKTTKQGSCCSKNKEEVDSVEYWKEQEDTYKQEYEQRTKELKDEDVEITHTAFVMFHHKEVASFAYQTNLWFNDLEFKLHKAPEYNAVNWSKTNDNKYTRPLRQFLFVFFVIMILVVWAFIVAAIQSLGNLTSLSQTKGLEWLAPILTWPSWLVNVIEGVLPPLLLMIIGVLIPVFTKLAISFQFLPDFSELEVRSRDVYTFILVFVNFFFVLGFGAVLQNINVLISGSLNVIEILAQSVPQQATFMMKFILNNAFIAMPGLLIQYPRIIFRPLFASLIGNTTTRQQITLNRVMSAFVYFKFHAIALHMAVIGFAYSTMAPLILVFVTLYYAIVVTVFKHNLYYTNYQTFTGGGRLYSSYIWWVMIFVYIKQLVMVALFSFFGAPAQAGCMTIPFVIALLNHYYIFKTYHTTYEYGCVYELVMDHFARALPAKYKKSVYVYPGIAPLEDCRDLSGIEHYHSEIEEA